MIAVFACVHLANHLAALASVAAHIAFMDAARAVYRQPVAQGLLLSCVACQICTGLGLVVRGWRRRHGAVAWLQALSGGALALFLLIHVGAVLYGRAALGLDTNFYFAAAGLHVAPYAWFFAPYYFVAVLALFTHVGCALGRRLSSASRARRALALGALMAVGGLVAMLIVLSLAGRLRTVDIPAKYLATYRQGESAAMPGIPPWRIRPRIGSSR